MTKKQKTEERKAVLHYWPARGRGELIRLSLVLAGKDWDEEDVGSDENAAELKKTKSGSAELPFGQWPLLVDENGHTHCQSNAIVRYVGRENGLYGFKNKAWDNTVDEVMDGVEALRGKYANLIWVKSCAEQDKDHFFESHVNPVSLTGDKSGGAHLGYLEAYLARVKDQHWTVVPKLSVADAAVFEIFDVVSRLFPKAKQLYPLLSKHHASFTEIPEVKEYIATRRYKSVNGNGLGD